MTLRPAQQHLRLAPRDFAQRILSWREGASPCAAIEGPMNGEMVTERWCWVPPALK